jgi:predicted lipid-binding transport protein (Tim44 family)
MIMGWVRQWMDEQAFRREVVETFQEQLKRILQLESIVTKSNTEIRTLRSELAEVTQQVNENVAHLRQLYSKAHTHVESPVEEASGNEVEGDSDNEATGNVDP